MAYQVDGPGGSDAAARARAAEEAAKRAAAEAARRAAVEAVQRQAKEAGERQKRANDSSDAEGAGRYAAYAAPEEAAPPPALKPPEPEAQGIMTKFRAVLGFGVAAQASPAKEQALSFGFPALIAGNSPAPSTGKSPEAAAIPAAIQEKVEQAKEQAPLKEAERQERLSAPTKESRSENAEVPIKADHEDLYNTLSPEQQKAFRELSPSARDDFKKVYEKIGGMWSEPTKWSKEAAHGMRKLLQEHRLEVKDTTGQSLLEGLAKRADQKLDSDMKYFQASGTLQSVIRHIAYPDHVFQGDNTNTCASAALQGILANEDPAEYARIATGLIFDGEVKLQSGAKLKLDASQVGNATDGDRSALSQALQTSFDAFAKQFPAQSDMDFGGGRAGGGGRYGGGRVDGGGRFGGGRVSGGGRYGEGEVAEPGTKAAIGGANGGQVDGGGLTQSQIEKLYENVAGRLAVNITVNDQNRFSTLDGVAAALADGQKVPVGVQGVDDQGNATHHMISVVAIKQDAEDPGKDQVVFTDPGTGDARTMPVKDFAQILEAAIIPAQYADHMRWNIAPNDSNPFGGGRAGSGGRPG